MSVDSQELADFKDWLAHAPTDLIQQRLDEDAIKRAWKRDLAEGEILRRATASTGGAFRSDSPSTLNARRHRAAVFYSWIVTIILVVSLVLASLASIMD